MRPESPSLSGPRLAALKLGAALLISVVPTMSFAGHPQSRPDDPPRSALAGQPDRPTARLPGREPAVAGVQDVRKLSQDQLPRKGRTRILIGRQVVHILQGKLARGFKGMTESLLFVYVPDDYKVVTTDNETYVDAPMSFLTELFARTGLKIDGLATVIHNHPGMPHPSDADKKTLRWLRERGFRGSFWIYDAYSKEYAQVSDEEG